MAHLEIGKNIAAGIMAALRPKLLRELGQRARDRAEWVRQQKAKITTIAIRINSVAARLNVAAAPKVLKQTAHQRAIVAMCEGDRNCKTPAVPGSGKSTTLIMCAEAYPNVRFLSLTYNKRLQEEVAKRIAQKGIKNLTALTYHGAASYAYRRAVHNDAILCRVLRWRPASIDKLKCDVLMLDETQDMAPQTYLFLRRVMSMMDSLPLFTIVGDPMQTLNEYAGARCEFLTECERVFVNGLKWDTRDLPESFRLTPSTARFVNTHVLGDNIIIGANLTDPDIKPLYISTSYHGMAKALQLAIRDAVEQYGVANVAVLAPSVRVKSTNPIYVAIKNLSDLPMYTHLKDGDVIDERETHGKLVFMTYNSAKGLEWDCVIVTSFDESYFKYYERKWSHPTRLPNTQLVATTRGRKKLVLMACHNQTFRSVQLDLLDDTATVEGKHYPEPPHIAAIDDPDMNISVTELIRHQPFASVMKILDAVEVHGTRTVVAPGFTPDMFIEFGDIGESVANLYGIVIPTLVELESTGDCADFNRWSNPIIVKTAKEREEYPYGSVVLLESDLERYPPGFWDRAKEIADTPAADRTLEDWFLLAVAKNAIMEGKHHLARQIANYDWIDAKFVEAAKQCMLTVLNTAGIGAFEQVLPTVKIGKKTIHGVADHIDAAGNLWEFKCCGDIAEDHILQTACYLTQLNHEVGYQKEIKTAHIYAFTGGKIMTIALKEDCIHVIETAVEKYEQRQEKIDIVEAIAKFAADHDIDLEGGERFDENTAIDETDNLTPDVESDRPAELAQQFTLDDMD